MKFYLNGSGGLFVRTVSVYRYSPLGQTLNECIGVVLWYTHVSASTTHTNLGPSFWSPLVNQSFRQTENVALMLHQFVRYTVRSFLFVSHLNFKLHCSSTTVWWLCAVGLSKLKSAAAEIQADKSRVCGLMRTKTRNSKRLMWSTCQIRKWYLSHEIQPCDSLLTQG